MRLADGRRWLVVALLAGVAYCVIGRTFAAPVRHQQAWRLAAWVVSGIVFLAQIAYEQAGRRAPRLVTALHAAFSAALGAFLLALIVAAKVWSTSPALRSRWLVALVAWPAITAVPAFLVALVLATILARAGKAHDAES